MPNIEFSSYECTILMNLLTDELELTASDRDWQLSGKLADLISRFNLYRIKLNALDSDVNPPELQ